MSNSLFSFEILAYESVKAERVLDERVIVCAPFLSSAASNRECLVRRQVTRMCAVVYFESSPVHNHSNQTSDSAGFRQRHPLLLLPWYQCRRLNVSSSKEYLWLLDLPDPQEEMRRKLSDLLGLFFAGYLLSWIWTETRVDGWR